MGYASIDINSATANTQYWHKQHEQQWDKSMLEY